MHPSQCSRAQALAVEIPFAIVASAQEPKKNWRNMWQMYTNVTKLVHIDENKTLSNSGQIKHI